MECSTHIERGHDTAPTLPVLSLPANGAIVHANPTFSWLASTGATKYQLQYATDSGFSANVFTTGELATTSYTPSPAMTVNTWYWRVKARDAAGNWSDWGAYRELHYHAPIPAAPLLTAPASGLVTNFNPIPTFTWNSVANGSYYRIQISLSPTFTTTTTDLTLGAGVLSYTPASGPTTDGVYYWHVAAINSDLDQGAYSAAWYFTLDTTPPAPHRC